MFSKLDAKHGYWGIHLDEESSKMCTFQSPSGKYRFHRLPFGLSVPQDVFQARMDRILGKVGQGVIGIADDVIVHGKMIEQHDRNPLAGESGSRRRISVSERDMSRPPGRSRILWSSLVQRGNATRS